MSDIIITNSNATITNENSDGTKYTSLDPNGITVLFDNAGTTTTTIYRGLQIQKDDGDFLINTTNGDIYLEAGSGFIDANSGTIRNTTELNGMGYDSRDNIFNPTSGVNTYFSISNTGQYLGGQSHFDQFNPVIEFYHTWFDYTLGGLIRSNSLRRWRVVQEFRTSSVFTYERVPKYNRIGNLLREADRQRNPYILQQDQGSKRSYHRCAGKKYLK